MSTFPLRSCGGNSEKGKKNGASDRNRTGDNHVGNVMLYQLSYTRIACYAFKLDHFLQKANAEM